MSPDRWDLSSDSDVDTTIVKEEYTMQDAQGPPIHEEHDFANLDNPTNMDGGAIPDGESHIDEAEHEMRSNEPKSSRTKVEAGIVDVDWDITTPRIHPPHKEWPLNAKELECLMPKSAFWHWTNRMFDDENYRNTRSFQTEKFTMSKVTHPDVKKHWQQRYREYAPNKKTTSIYSSFIRLLIAEFFLKWKVDYTWENADGSKPDLPIHPSVATLKKIIKSREASMEALPSANMKSHKKRTDDPPKSSLQQKGKAVVPPFSVAKCEPATTPVLGEVNLRKRKHLANDDNNSVPNSGIDVECLTNQSMSMNNVCKSLGAEIGELIEKSLLTKYKMELCESSTILEFKSKLQLADAWMKTYQNPVVPPPTNDQMKNMKVALYDQGEEIKELKQQLAEKDGQSTHTQLAKKEEIIKNLQVQIEEQKQIILTLQDDVKSANESRATHAKNKGKSIAEEDNFFHMKMIDPTLNSNLYPGLEMDADEVDNYFEEWKKNEKMAKFVQDSSKCSWCQLPWGPESVSMLGTCGHIWHHACLGKWLEKSRKCWCRTYFHDREYEQRGITVSDMPSMDTQFTEEMSEIPAEHNDFDSIPISHFTINEENLRDSDFDKLLLSGRLNEWKEYARDNQPTIDERNWSRTIRAHRRRQELEEMLAKSSQT